MYKWKTFKNTRVWLVLDNVLGVSQFSKQWETIQSSIILRVKIDIIAQSLKTIS